ncbi:MAG: FkbM family methyltransferase [Parachlamydiaceae bacterium]|nr:FkbM family methyltransferase [Parachlamydiaceae bacterium]
MKLTIKCSLFLVAIFSFLTSCNAIENPPGMTHPARLELLKKKGFNPQVIYDIGAFRGMWSLEMQPVFPKANFFLFEANDNNESYLKRLSFPFFIAALGDREDKATFYSNNSTGDSLLKEQTQYYCEGRCVAKQVQMTTLEKIVLDNKLPLPDLIKMDVQGAEKLIIKGSPDIVKHAEVIILETKILEYNKDAPLIYEIITLMNTLGYRMIDILELHYLRSQELNEVDILFIKENSPLIKKGLLS